ncbi:hypothetical protein YC2023_016942 [Brassica napus]
MENKCLYIYKRNYSIHNSHSPPKLSRAGSTRENNKRLKCLQDIVPGCYKAMGMATILDEIINYVQSLQNQVEFISGGIAAGTYNDFKEMPVAMESRDLLDEAEGSNSEDVFGSNPIEVAPSLE